MRPANGRKSDDSLNILPIFSVELKVHFFHFFNPARSFMCLMRTRANLNLRPLFQSNTCIASPYKQFWGILIDHFCPRDLQPLAVVDILVVTEDVANIFL